MIEQDIKWVEVGANSADNPQMQKAALLIEEWLASSPGAKDKPVDEILDPEFKGVFWFLEKESEDGWVADLELVPVAFVAQRALVYAYESWDPKVYSLDGNPTALREISSLIVNPDWQGQGIGSELIDAYTQYLLEQRPTTALVAVAHPGSVPAFNRAGYNQVPLPDYGSVDTFSEQNLIDRVKAGEAAGKVLMAHGASIN